MEIDEAIKDLIRQNGHLIFENEKLMAINEQLREQIRMLNNIIENIFDKKENKDE